MSSTVDLSYSANLENSYVLRIYLQSFAQSFPIPAFADTSTEFRNITTHIFILPINSNKMNLTLTLT